MTARTVEIVATGLTPAETVDLLHDYAARVDVLRDRARLIVAVANRTTPGWKAKAVGTLRDTLGTRWADFSDLVAAVRWACDNPDN